MAPDLIRKHEDYLSLTNEQRANVQNGCGGKSGWVRPIKWYDLTAVCNFHDYLYSVGINQDDRLKADQFLRDAILALGSDLNRWGPKYWYYWTQSHIYYYAVRLCGNKFFGANK